MNLLIGYGFFSIACSLVWQNQCHSQLPDIAQYYYQRKSAACIQMYTLFTPVYSVYTVFRQEPGAARQDLLPGCPG
jgi:hypothetical protein